MHSSNAEDFIIALNSPRETNTFKKREVCTTKFRRNPTEECKLVADVLGVYTDKKGCTNIPVLFTSLMRDKKPDYKMILLWNVKCREGSMYVNVWKVKVSIIKRV